MTSKETFTHYQPLGNSDPAHTATAPGGLSAKAPAMTPLMLDTSTRKLVAWHHRRCCRWHSGGCC